MFFHSFFHFFLRFCKFLSSQLCLHLILSPRRRLPALIHIKCSCSKVLIIKKYIFVIKLLTLFYKRIVLHYCLWLFHIWVYIILGYIKCSILVISYAIMVHSKHYANYLKNSYRLGILVLWVVILVYFFSILLQCFY